MDYLKEHVKLAKQCKTGKEFYERGRKRFKNVPKETADWFYGKYNSTGMLSMEKASQDFVDDVHEGKYDHFLEPFLYKRKEIIF